MDNFRTIKCNRCGVIKPQELFYRTNKNRGFDGSCKECRKSLVNLNRKANLDRYRAYDRQRGLLSHRKELCIINTRKRRKDPDGYMAAHNAVARALKSGKIERMPCCMCGSTEKIHAHHDDYLQPFNVMWLCVVHHKARHSFLEYKNEDIF